MTVINGYALLADPPIVEMFTVKMRSANGVSHGLAEVGYDIRLKQEIYFMPPDKNYVPHHYIDGIINEGNFCLASAIEEFQMPDNLMGVVHDKSTWARKGLSVFNTVIEPGWKGFLTLELVYHGSKRLHLPAGTGIAQVVFHRLANPANYNGPYQNQEDRPVSSVIDR